MYRIDVPKTQTKLRTRHTFFVMFFWLFFVSVSFFWNIQQETETNNVAVAGGVKNGEFGTGVGSKLVVAGGDFYPALNRGVLIGSHLCLCLAGVASILFLSSKTKKTIRNNIAAEKELQTFAKELEQKNVELTSFAYMASHDLQEPLRKIITFSDRLHSRHGEALGPQGVDYLMRMQKAAGRMQTLTNDLLALTRVTTKARPFVAVNLNVILEEVLADLELAMERSGGNVLVGKMPIVKADPTQMRQLFQNLVINGLKFQEKGNVPEVIIVSSFCDSDDSTGNFGEICEITVSDNGIGIEEKYQERIFEVFQRLHGRNDYEGTGIGLAICRKIVERHGGSIGVHSALGKGAEFHFTLPVFSEEGG